MSAEEETTGSAPQDVAGQKPAKESAATKPVAARTPATKAKAQAEKTSPAEKTSAVEKASAAKKPAGKKPVAKKVATAKKRPAAKEPAAAKEPQVGKEPVAKAPEKKAAPRAAKGARPTSRRRVVRAYARYVRTSARKARMVCGHLRGKSVQEARAILAFTPREVARDWSKLLESAVANAESNHELLEDDLIVREAYADEGPTIKRFRPRAMGRATPIRKRTSHLTITLTTGSQSRTTKRQS
jgi:ribosomal protein L22